VNNDESLPWKAEAHPRFASMSDAALHSLFGEIVRPADSKIRLARRSPPAIAPEDIPATFDAMDYFGACGKQFVPYDQGKCGSCWALSAVKSISSRFCLASKFGKGIYKQLSSNMMTSCNEAEMGCNGGSLTSAWTYAWVRGLATEECMPYLQADGGPFETCAAAAEPCLPPFQQTPACVEQCANSSTPWQVHHLSEVYEIWSASDYKAELMSYGPFQISMTVLSDFVHYKSGVYVPHANATELGGHAITLHGWGQEAGVDYWLVSNSWTPTWGDNGRFKIKQGVVGIDDGGVAGTP
jgi:C1A family cysteine protease